MMKNHLKQANAHSLKLSEGLYEITQLKHEPQDFRTGEIKREMERGKQIQSLYQMA